MDERNNYEEYEIDLKEYILLIWNKKFLLMGLILFAMIAAVIFTNFVADPQYEASSTLLIMPPMYTTSIEVGSFPIETYRELSRTAQMRTKIIEELDLRDDDGELISQSSLEDKMEFEITGREEVEREEEMVEVPLVRLNVIHRDAEVAADIANLWAELFMKDTREVRRAETTEISNMIESRFEDTRERLTSTREELKNFLTETGLEELKMKLSSKQNQLEQVINNKTDLEHDVTIMESELNEIEDQIDELNIDGMWAGELGLNNDWTEIPQAVQRYSQSRERLLNHRQEYNFDLMKQEIDRYEERVLFYKTEIEDIKRNIEINNKLIESVEGLLTEEPDRWELNKSLSEDVIWQEFFNPEELEAISNVVLNEEIVNPLYRKLRDIKQKTQIEQDTFEVELTELESDYNSSRNALEELQDGFEKQNDLRARLIVDKDHYEKIYNQEASFYRTLEDDYRILKTNLRQKRDQYETLQNEEERLSEKVAELDNQIREHEIVKEELNQELNNYQESYQQLEPRVEEARLAQAEQTSDVKFIADAVIPDRATVGVNNTILNMAVAAVLAGMLGVFGIFFAEFIKEDNK